MARTARRKKSTRKSTRKAPRKSPTRERTAYPILLDIFTTQVRPLSEASAAPMRGDGPQHVETGELLLGFPLGDGWETQNAGRVLLPKIGLLVNTDESVTLDYRSATGTGQWTPYVESTDFTGQLSAVMGLYAGEKWVGFEPDPSQLIAPIYPQPTVAAWHLRLTIVPAPHGQRLIRMAMKNYRAPFSNVHLTALWGLGNRRFRK